MRGKGVKEQGVQQKPHAAYVLPYAGGAVD